MKRRTFLTSAITLLAAPFVSISKSEETPKVDRLKLNHLYNGAYHDPNDLWTPEEITDAGFVFVEYPTFIHRFDDPYNPIMKSYCDFDPNLKPMICRSRRYCDVGYYRDDATGWGETWRGIHSVSDYCSKKEIFKPQILEWMKKNEYHYIYKVMLENSPCIRHGEHPSTGTRYDWFYSINVRGCRLPSLLG